jgi:putative tryptophan/tyrosine transport system substrate-binding protein
MKMFFCLFIISIFLISCNSQKKGICIGICQIANNEVLDIARNNVVKALKDAGYEEGKNLTIDYKNAQGEITNAFMILKEFQSKKVDLIIANGTPVMTCAAQVVKNIPVVYTVSFCPEQVGMKNSPENICGTYDELKMDQMLKIIKQSLPNIIAIGNPYSPAEPNAQFAAKKLKAECDKLGITLYQVGVNSTNDITQATQSLANHNIQALIIASDNMIYAGMSGVVSVADAQKIPLFVTDPLLAMKGASLGYGVSFEDWGYESGSFAVQILKGKKPTELGHKALDKETVMYNKKAAQAQGFIIPEIVMKRVTKVIE